MTTSTVKTNRLGLTQPEMEKFFDSIGEKRFRAGQVMKWIHHFGVDDFDAMTNVRKALRDKLKAIAEVRGPEVVSEDIASDGTMTATVLAQAIVREGAKSVAAGLNPMDFKCSMDMAVAVVLEELQRKSRKSNTSAEIAQVGSVSANGDSEIGQMIA